MALVLADRVRETSTSIGTGTIALAGAFPGFQSFAAGVGTGNTTYYTIANIALGEWEVGLGTYTTSGSTLTRATVFSSSTGTSLVNFSAGTKDVFVTQPAGRAVYLDAAGNASTLGTPVAFVGTNITGTAAGLTAGNTTTNANLTGAVTSVGNASSLGSFTSAQLAGALTDETGSGATVFSTSPTLVTPALGTPTALVGTNITGTAAGLTAGNTTTNANLTGAVTSIGNAASLGSFTSAQLAGALTDETGSGASVFATSPTLVTPALGTPTALVGTNITGTAAAFNINGTVGATTPAAATVTVLTATADSAFTSTGSVTVAKGTTAQRPATPVSGMFRFNTTTVAFEGYNGTAFASVGGGATGGGTDQVFVENGRTVTTNYTITAGKNAMSTGPVTVNSGVVVTVPSGSRYVVI